MLVGDSTTDITAGHAAGVAVIAYANKPGKRQAFADHRQDAVIDTTHEIPVVSVDGVLKKYAPDA